MSITQCGAFYNKFLTYFWNYTRLQLRFERAAVPAGRFALTLAEKAREVKLIAEIELLGDLGDGLIGEQQLPRAEGT